ncbi:hypothetical protein F4806DRAFT_495558 [Annulohypoxylon nitens]|nr:hypothetical protein F4806DRAFT_495558 [Annulohypoxylon nitens]
MSDTSVGVNGDMELLWTVATSLSMNGLTNNCMHIIVIKYRWGFSARVNIAKKIHPGDCLFHVWGLYPIFPNCERLGFRYTKLLGFMEDLIRAGGTRTKRKRENANSDTIESLQVRLEGDEDFRVWINTTLKGVQHENDEAVLRTLRRVG